jgi:UDP:flavonoid glycosyltransferase YjiC (YdhE family)
MLSTRKHLLVIGDSMSLAHTARAMIVARRLESQGHRITFATGPAYLSLARREGFDPHEIYAVAPERAIEAIRKGSHIFDKQTLARYVESDLALIERVKPDLIVADFRLTLNISAELAKVPYWNILNGYMTRFYAAPQKPPQTFPAVRMLGHHVSSFFFPVIKGLTLRYYAWNFNRYRKRVGLKPAGNIFQVMESPYRNFIADLPEFIPCANLPPHFQYIGPLIWEPRLPDPPWLGDIRPNVPTVYVTMGSTGGAHDFHRVLVILRDAGYQVLATTGGQVAEIPSGVFAVEYAPGSALLRHSQAVVCHGGNLTIYQAVREGVPIVGIPTFHDQELNLERVEAVGWGFGLHPTRWSADDLLSAIRKVLDPQIQERLQGARQRLIDMVSASEAAGFDIP